MSPAPAVKVFEFGEEELFPTPVELFVVYATWALPERSGVKV